MTRKDIAVASLVALGTMTLALSVFRLVRPAGAVGEEKARPTPVLKKDGVKMTLTLKKTDYKAGEKPEMVLDAVNTTANAVKVDATVLISEESKPEPMLRRPPISRNTWSKPCQIALNGGETKRIDLTPDVAAQAGRTLTFTISCGDQRMVVASLSVPDAEISAPVPSAQVEEEVAQ
jgi:hypothetical protein